MTIVRSVLAIVIGAVIAVVVIRAVEMANFVQYGPSAEKPIAERLEIMQKMKKEDPDAMKAWMESLPTSAMVMVVVSYGLGAFLGGALAGLIASCCRMTHAGIIGGLVLAGTIYNFINMKNKLGFSHPDWMIIAGLLAPLALALLAGSIVTQVWAPPPEPQPTPPASET